MQKIDRNIGLQKRQFFAENWDTSLKIVIITLNPGQLFSVSDPSSLFLSPVLPDGIFSNQKYKFG
jgi:hypothetical protein